MSERDIEGGCLCGQVRYRVRPPLAGVIACHCRQCRKMSGHVFAATAVSRNAFEVTCSSGLTWYRSSDTSRRGFCRGCGSSLFFDHGKDQPIAISAGSFDGDPPLRMAAHIYTDEAGAYYTINDGVDQYDACRWQQGGWQRLRLQDRS